MCHGQFKRSTTYHSKRSLQTSLLYLFLHLVRRAVGRLAGGVYGGSTQEYVCVAAVFATTVDRAANLIQFGRNSSKNIIIFPSCC